MSLKENDHYEETINESKIEKKKKWDINDPTSRIKIIPIPNGFTVAPRRGDGNLY